MKRTLSLIGLLVLGILLLFNPDTGLITAVAGDMTVTLPVAEEPSTAMDQSHWSATSTTTGEPPPTDTPTSEAPQLTTSTVIAAPADGSVLGVSVPTQFGPFQVEIVIENGEMVDVITIEEPHDRKSEQINDYVIPLYEEDVISTQSADIDAISGATITWGAYTASVESAMIEAGI
ncbi:MAG: FMN-binding protein [Acidimicrobiia bacterium]